MKAKEILNSLPGNFREEAKELRERGVNTWEAVQGLRDEELCDLAKNTRATQSNLRRLQGIANFVCELNLTQHEASLLLHSGISTVKALADSTPQELTLKTGRLERQLNSFENPKVNLRTAHYWIQRAKKHQIRT